MRRIIIYMFFLALGFNLIAQPLPTKSEVLSQLKKANGYWMTMNPVPGDNRWARSVYFTALMDFYTTYPKPDYLDYALLWANNNNWALNGGVTTRHADNHCAGQVYFDLYLLDDEKQPTKIEDIHTSIATVVNDLKNDDWWWIDAMYMAMPVFIRLGNLFNDESYRQKMHAMYLDTKINRKLYNSEIGLWYRDERYLPPNYTPNGEHCFWSRGNGWVFGALVRVLSLLPQNHEYRAEYEKIFLEMAQALGQRQRKDGFWNVSLDDPNDYGGPETSGTAFFTYGLAWGINTGILDYDVYLPIVEKAWDALSNVALQTNGLLGYVQGVGERPSSSQPVTSTSTNDFGVGAFLLAGTEVIKLAEGTMPQPSPLYINEIDIEDFKHIRVHFSEALDPVSATLLANYKVDGLTLTNVDLADDRHSVLISLSELHMGRYELVVKNIIGQSSVPVEYDERKVFVYNGSITVSASSFQEGTENTPDKTLDYSYDTRWSAEGEGQWLRYDLGQAEIVRSVDISFYLGDRRSAYFSIGLSLDGISFTEVFNGQSGGQSLLLENFDFVDQKARYIKITGYGNSVSKWNSITRVQVNTDESTDISIKPLVLNEQLLCYPNPYESGVLYIKLKQYPTGKLYVRIFDLTGQCCWLSNESESCFNNLILKEIHLKSGMYSVVVSDEKQLYSGLLCVR